MDLIVSTGWFMLLAFFTVSCWYGFRHGRNAWPVVAMAMGFILCISSWYAFLDMGHVMAGYPYAYESNLFTLASMAVAFMKSGDWVSVARG